jgi:hypothetical protein
MRRPCTARPTERVSMAGAVIIVVLMILVIPTAIFVGGFVWSALVGHFLVTDAEERYAGREELERKLW